MRMPLPIIRCGCGTPRPSFLAIGKACEQHGVFAGRVTRQIDESVHRDGISFNLILVLDAPQLRRTAAELFHRQPHLIARFAPLLREVIKDHAALARCDAHGKDVVAMGGVANNRLRVTTQAFGKPLANSKPVMLARWRFI